MPNEHLESYDAIIIGGGPAGYVAAIWLAKAGVKTCIIENHKFGGTCLNYGCIPTKALYHYAKMIHQIHKHQDIGLSTSDLVIELRKIMAQKQETVETLVNGVSTLMLKNNIKVYHGSGKFMDDHNVQVESESGIEVVYGKYILIATGSEVIIPPIDGIHEAIDQNFVITSKEALSLELVPEELVIIGGGVIGMEFGTIYNQFGSNVTIIEATDFLLPSFNKDLVKRYKPLAKKQGLNVITGAMVTSIAMINNNKVELTYETKKGLVKIEADKVICAVGRKPRFHHINLQQLSTQLHDNRKIIVNDYMQTSLSHIYAIGDVNGLSLLAHSASKQGLIAATKIINSLALQNDGIETLPEPKPFSFYAVPQVAFLLPEISQTQRSEVDVEANIKSGKFTYRSNGMALASIEADGICKVDYDEKNERLVYMGLLGESSSELIQMGVHFIDHQLNFDALTDNIVGHPSLNEILHEALLDIRKKGIHQL